MSVGEELAASFKASPARIKLFPSKEELEFSSVDKLISYVESEKDFWKPMEQGQMREIGAHFTTAYTNLIQAMTAANVDQANNLLKRAIDSMNRNRFPGVFSSTTEAQILKRLYESSPGEAEGYCSYKFNRPPATINNPAAYFRGMMSAFFYHDATKDIEKIARARDEALDLSVHKQLSELNELQRSFSTLLNEIKENNERTIAETDKWKHDFTVSVEEWSNSERTKLVDLEALYAEKLRLEGPATYWKTLSDQYEKKGRRWRSWAVGAALALMASFIGLLLIPLAALPPQLATFSPESIRGILVLAFIASVGIYIVRLFVRLSTSAFHLARDATERFYLTHLYLALANDKKIVEAERAIVLQSLFSRADTGLLRGDSSPAFPEGLASQIVKNLKP